MMPTGVEHWRARAVHSPTRPLNVPMMPTGVEHKVMLVRQMFSSMSECFACAPPTGEFLATLSENAYERQPVTACRQYLSIRRQSHPSMSALRFGGGWQMPL